MKISAFALLVAVAAGTLSTVCLGQETSADHLIPEYLMERQSIISDFDALEARTIGLNKHAQAFAKIEIADGLWAIDMQKSQGLLRQALILTIRTENDPKPKGKEISNGLYAPSAEDLSSKRLRTRIFRIAARNPKVLDALMHLLVKREGDENAKKDASLDLANEAIKNGDFSGAADSIGAALGTGNFDIGIGQVIFALSLRDREAADQLILQTISRLRATPVSPQVFSSVIVGLDWAVYGEAPLLSGQPSGEAASSTVIQTYLSFQIDKMLEIGSRVPEGIRALRGRVLALWPRIVRCAPELTPRFQLLEVQSRIDPNDAQLPDQSESQMEHDEKAYKNAENSRDSDDVEKAITIALGKKDFKKAKELASLITNEKVSQALFDRIHAAEVKFLIDNRTLVDAEAVLNKIVDIKLYLISVSRLVRAHGKKGQSTQARDLSLAVLSRIRKVDENANLGSSLGNFTRTLTTFDPTLAFEFLNATVRHLNRKNLSPEANRIDFDTNLFRDLALVDMAKAQDGASMLTDNFRKVVALAQIYRLRSNKNVEKEKAFKSKLKALATQPRTSLEQIEKVPIMRPSNRN